MIFLKALKVFYIYIINSNFRRNCDFALENKSTIDILKFMYHPVSMWETGEKVEGKDFRIEKSANCDKISEQSIKESQEYRAARVERAESIAQNFFKLENNRRKGNT